MLTLLKGLRLANGPLDVEGRPVPNGVGELDEPNSFSGDGDPAPDLLAGLSKGLADLLAGLSNGLGEAPFLLVGLSNTLFRVGMVGSVADFSGSFGAAAGAATGAAAGSGLGSAGRIDFSSFSSTTPKSFWKDTMGLPGASDTMVGVGSFGLRFLRLKPVAARNSSLLISFPSFSLTSGSFSASALPTSLSFDLLLFSVYPAFLDCVGSFLWISYRSKRFILTMGSVLLLTIPVPLID